MVDIKEILMLPAEERLRIAELIWESLDVSNDLDLTEEQKGELQKRLEEYESGQDTQVYSWAEVKAMLHRK
jgi:putative addiction module component (TIGR02574 family)